MNTTTRVWVRFLAVGSTIAVRLPAAAGGTRTVKNEPAKIEPVKNEPVKNEPAKIEAASDQGAGGNGGCFAGADGGASNARPAHLSTPGRGGPRRPLGHDVALLRNTPPGLHRVGRGTRRRSQTPRPGAT